MVKLSGKINKDAPVYISGPITSRVKLGEDWRRYFNDAEDSLRRIGFKNIVNPVGIAHTVDRNCALAGRKATYADYMKADIEALIKCKTILMLQSWDISAGATLEYQIADALGMEIIYEH